MRVVDLNQVGGKPSMPASEDQDSGEESAAGTSKRSGWLSPLSAKILQREIWMTCKHLD